MLPETILQSDVLDILFENRNKTYGAYMLRKQYNGRLAKAIVSVAVLSLLLALLLNFYKEGGVKKVENYVTETVTLMELPTPREQPKKQPQVKYQSPVKPLPQVKFIDKIDIVKTQVIDTIPTVKTLEISIAGDKNIKGDAAAPVEIQSGNGPSGLPELKKEEVSAEAPMDFAEKMPQYPGGNEAFQKFMQRNLKQPDDLDAGEKIIVTVRFVVEKDGSIKAVELVNSGRKDLDEEVLKAVRKMPLWVPGLQNGKKVAVYFKLPVSFVSQEQ